MERSIREKEKVNGCEESSHKKESKEKMAGKSRKEIILNIEEMDYDRTTASNYRKVI